MESTSQEKVITAAPNAEKNIWALEKKAQAIKARAQRKTKIKSDLARVNDMARKANMSYGQYVARLKCDKEREQRLRKKQLETMGE